MSPDAAQHPLIDHASLSALPLELVQALNQTYFLRLLVTDPQRVIPPGKSLLSMMTNANFKVPETEPQVNRAELMDRVKEMAHRAFWNEALEQLSSPLPSVQIARLKQLYFDLHESLTPLFPPSHPILTALSSPLPPTPSPLRSTINLLIEILSALRNRCAPIRDQTIDDLLLALSQPPSPKHLYDTPDAAYRTKIAGLAIGKLKALLSLAEDIKTDLNTFVLGAMTESQLQGVLLNEVKIRERELVLKIWGGKDVVRGRWRSWVSETSPSTPLVPVGKKWINRLFRALESDQALYCPLPSSYDSQPPVVNSLGQKQPDVDSDALSATPKLNLLPPQLFFSAPSLLYIQNYLQAILIAAALRSLTRLPSHSFSPLSSSSSRHTNPNDFMSRIWTLLEAELNHAAGGAVVGVTDKHDVGHTRLINLADEVVRARLGISAPKDRTRSHPSLDPEEERRLRAAVDRTLCSADPVFLLLKKRLVCGIEKRVLSLFSSNDDPTKSTQAIPIKMQTGNNLLEERVGKRLRLNITESVLAPSETSGLTKDVETTIDVIIPGFEEIILQREIDHVFRKIIGSVGWIEGIWGDLV